MLFTRLSSLNLCYFTYSGFLDSWIEEFLDSSGKSNLEFLMSFSTDLIILFEGFFKYIFLKFFFCELLKKKQLNCICYNIASIVHLFYTLASGSEAGGM